MTKQEHIERHKELHKVLDELMADFIHHSGRRLSNTTVLELMKWSHNQTIEPAEKD